MKKSTMFKSLAGAVLLGAGALLMPGCADPLAPDLLAPPDVSSAENAQRIWRFAGYDQQQLIDDFDKEVTMTRPTGYLTPWNVRSGD